MLSSRSTSYGRAARPPPSRYTPRPNVEGLPQLRARSRFRTEPQPLHARYQAPLRSEPPEGPDLRGRCSATRVRLHALPQGRQGHQGRLAQRRACALYRPTDALRSHRVRSESRPLPRGGPRRARAPRVPPPGDQRSQRLPGRRRRHGRQHGAHAQGGPRRARSPGRAARPLDRRDRPRRDRRDGRPRRPARRARQQRRHPLPADPRRRRGAGLAPRRAGRSRPARRRASRLPPNGPTRPCASRPRARCSR